MQSDLYIQRGVSPDKADVHKAIANLDKGLFPNAFCKILPNHLAPGATTDDCLILHVDTAGTKPALAYMWWRETGDLSVWRGIAQDALVMNFDDMACAGAANRFVVSSNIARNKHRIPGEVVAELIQGCSDFLAHLARLGIEAHLAGGETADVGDVVRTLDVGYTVAATLPRKQVLQVNPQPGDVIVGLASYGQADYETAYNSGIGCNGLTSARHDLFKPAYRDAFPETYAPETDPQLIYNGKHGLADTLEIEGKALHIGLLALSPTRTYLPILQQVIIDFRDDIHAIVHCTGGGQTKVLHFAKDVRIVKDNLLPVPAIFLAIQAAAPTPWRQMFRTFNMGHRMELYVPEAIAPAIISQANHFGVAAQVVGHVEKLPGHSELVMKWLGETHVYQK